jgi:hypothetical protein
VITQLAASVVASTAIPGEPVALSTFVPDNELAFAAAADVPVYALRDIAIPLAVVFWT